ncbi:MAG: S-layer homology domain-containing protein [Clostridia bacterium]|nr:S-layer homology domain-containing protein [Clostridia bacterium]
MKKNRITLFAALLITIIVSVLNTAYAKVINEPQIDSNNMIIVSGKTDAGYTPVTIKVYETGKDITKVDLNNISDTYYFIREITSNSNGDYDFQIPVSGTDKYFNICVKEGKSKITETNVHYTNSIANEALQMIKNANDNSELKTALDKFLSGINFDFSLYENKKTEIENSEFFYKIIQNSKNTEAKSADDFKKYVEYATVLYSLSNSQNIDDFKSIFDDNKDIIFLYSPDVRDLFNNCTNEGVKTSVINKVYNVKSNENLYSDKKEFNSFLQDTIILSSCEENLGYSAFDEIISSLSKIYSNDSSFSNSVKKYYLFTNSKKNEAAVEIIGHEFDSVEAVIKRFEEIIENMTSSEKASNNNSGGGSGGGGFRFSTGKNIPVSENVSKEEKSETKFIVNIPDLTGKVIVFNDLEDVDWAKESISNLVSRNIINGKQENCFAPNDCVTREEFIKMLVCAIGINGDEYRCSFDDVEDNSWYYKYVAIGFNNGIINGVGDNNFGCGEFITRQDIAAMVGRVINKIGINGYSENYDLFADDNNISAYAKDNVYNLKRLNILNGKGDNMFDPNGFTTRAEAAKIVSAMIDNIENFNQKK